MIAGGRCRGELNRSDEPWQFVGDRDGDNLGRTRQHGPLRGVPADQAVLLVVGGRIRWMAMIPLRAAPAATAHRFGRDRWIMLSGGVPAPHTVRSPQRRSLDGTQHRHRNRQPGTIGGTQHSDFPPTDGKHAIRNSRLLHFRRSPASSEKPSFFSGNDS